MCTFLAINTSSVQLIPATAIAILAAAGSARPTVIVGTAFFATLCAATVAVISAKFFERLVFFKPRREPTDGKDGPPGRSERSGTSQRDVPTESTTDKFAFDGDSLGEPPLSRPAPWGMIALALLVVFFVMLFARMVMPEVFRLPLPTDPTLQNPFARMSQRVVDPGDPVLAQLFPSLRHRARHQGLRRVRGRCERSAQRDFANHSVFGHDAGRNWNVQRRGRNRFVDQVAQSNSDAIAFSNRSGAAGLDASVERQRHARALDRRGASARPGQHH